MLYIRQMDTKLVGDIAEQRAVLEGLQRGWAVFHPVGDRLPYDLAFERNGVFIRLQVKSAYRSGNGYAVKTMRSKTNRTIYKFETYEPKDFDFALIWHPGHAAFYVMPIASFLEHKSGVTLPGLNKTHPRVGRAEKYLSAWHLLDEHIARLAI